MPNDTNPRLVHGQPTSTRNSTRGFDKHVWPPTEGWPDGVTMQVYDNGRIKIGAKHATIAVDDVSTFRPGPSHHGSAHSASGSTRPTPAPAAPATSRSPSRG